MQNYKKFLGVFFVFLLFISGCGKVAKETQDISVNQDTVVEQPVDQATETEFVSSVKELLSGYVNNSLTNVEMQKVDTTLNLATNFSLAAVNDGYLYWNYSAVTVNNGNVTEAYLGQYRYYDRRTGLLFNKLEKDFNTEDLNNIYYIERFLQIKGFYEQSPYDPNKTIYKLNYHEKIVPKGYGTYTITLFDDGASTMEYIGWPWSILTVTQRDIEYDSATKSGTGTMKVTAASPYQNYHFDFMGGVRDDKMYGDASVFSGSNILGLIKIVGESQNVETKYYVGKNYTYSSLTSLSGGLEDNITIEFQDSQSYSETTTLDGASNLSATNPVRNRNVKITTKADLENYPTLTSLLTLKNFDNLTIEKLNFSKKGIRIINCTGVVINGTYYDQVTDTTFKN